MNKNYYELGQKIRNFRKRANKSQMDLELEIGAAPGSLSRIENGEVNPTKETLMKIGDALQLNTTEIANLQNIEVLSPEEVMKAINTFTRSLDIDEIIRSAVDILFRLYPNYNGSVVFLQDEDNENILRPKAVSQMPGIQKVYQLIGGGVDMYPLVLNDEKSKESNVVRTFKTGEYIIDNEKLSNFSRGAINDNIADAVGIILGFKTGITMPLDYGAKRIGVMMYTKDIDEGFSAYEQKILKLLTDQIAIAVSNARLFKELKENK